MPLTAPVTRCWWAKTPASIAYHDDEWGVPLHDDRALFELLVLEGAQAGLSWETILAKRAGYRRAFAGFDIARVAAFDDDTDVERLLADGSIVRNRAKIRAAIANARAVETIVTACGSFDAYVWSFVGGSAVVNAPRSPSDVPETTPGAERFSKDLRARGCRFAGPTIVYAFMQAAGLVDDHLTTCFRSSTRRGDARK